MIKRMAGKFAPKGYHKGLDQNDIHPFSQPASASAHPESSSASAALQYDYRGSISTARTSASLDDADAGMMAIEPQRILKPSRPKGTYRLHDFIIQRTLGTGSFGRVHLGMLLLSIQRTTLRVLLSSQQTQFAVLRNKGSEQRTHCENEAG
jgi:hypothetical protein